MSEEAFVFPMSYAQRRLWFLEQLEPGSLAYHIPAVLNVKGTINDSALRQSLQAVVERHESLRTTFRMVDGEPCQIISPSAEAALQIIDGRGYSEAERDKSIQRAASEITSRAFDLSHGPLLRAALITISESESILVFAMHHIVSDGWSMSVLIREIGAFYSAFSSGEEALIKDLEIQYADFSEWQRQTLEGPEWERLLGYWESNLKNAPPLLDLPADKPRPAVKTYNGAVERFSIDQDVIDNIGQLCKERSATLFMALTAAFAAMASRYTGKDDIVLATLLAGRNKEELEPLIGFFVNTLPLRIDIAGDPSFSELLERTRKTSLDAYAHQDAPFDKLVEALKPERSLSHTPIVNVMLTLQNAPVEEMNLPGATFTKMENPGKISARFDLELYLWQSGGQLHGDIVYNTDLFSAGRIRRMGAHFSNILHAISQNASLRLSELPLLSSDETSAIIEDWNQTSAEYPRDKGVIRLFEERAAATPNAIAVKQGQEGVTYSYLNSQANAVAASLRNRDVGPNSIVAIMMNRSIEAIIAILGIMKSGAAYLPVDMKYPESRILHMLKTSGAELAFTSGTVELKDIPGITMLDISGVEFSRALHENPAPTACADDLAYVIFTSGSTGAPKGAAITRGGLANYICWAQKVYGRGAPVNFPLFTSLSFDLTVTSIFTPLTTGGAVLVYPDGDSADASILKVISDNEADVIKLTPSHLAIMAQEDLSPLKAKRLILGGEELKTTLAKKIHESTKGKVEILNEYGPTETVVGCMIYKFDPAADTGTAVPIGKPADNVRLYILDRALNPAPIGVPGELYIAGDGVARGYINNPVLTAERFIKDPFAHCGAMYKSGDMACWREDGVMELLGRADTQIKVQGYRIEPGEIETAMLSFNGVAECVALAAGGDNVSAQHAEAYCAVCGLPSNYPGASFDSDGVCSACRAFEGYKDKAMAYFKTPADLEAVFTPHAASGNGHYDCLALYSGGKDSTYMLFKLSEMGLRILAFTFDNGYLYEGARENIKRIVAKLGVDHVFGNVESIKGILADSLRRYSNVCNECFKVVYTLGVQLAREKGIKNIVTGLSRGQLFETRLAELCRQSVFGEREIEKAVLDARKLYHRMDDAVSRNLDVSLFQNDAIFDELNFIDFYRYTDITREGIMNYLANNAPWINPAETEGCTTNCVINDAGIYVHTRERKFNNYALPNSWEVRVGHKSRDTSIRELESPLDMPTVKKILREIGYDGVADDSWKRLIAYYTSSGQVNEEALRAHLAKTLPEYMIPSAFVRVDKLPLTSNGKVDTKALLSLAGPLKKQETLREAPRNSVEKKIAAIWDNALDSGNVGIHDNFFELGGHSLMATQVVSRLRAEFNMDLPLISIFEKPTVAQLAELIIKNQANAIGESELDDILAEVAGMSEEEARNYLDGQMAND